MKKYVILFIFKLIVCNCLLAQMQFNIQSTNGPYGGNMWSFCYDSRTKDIYVNTLGHIYKLNIATNEWERQFAELDPNENYLITLVYADSIYLITRLSDHGGDGLFRSTGKGKSWKEVDDKYLDYLDIISTKSKYIFGTGGFGGTTNVGKITFP
ncbi:MAG: hypothetical protein EPN82_01500 [Bacteroidetes bacterium]|nr:MAG: hypothetical protein EPN82_01500 [Bacteroidota bacterium]